jgi:hypothetical protein
LHNHVFAGFIMAKPADDLQNPLPRLLSLNFTYGFQRIFTRFFAALFP